LMMLAGGVLALCGCPGEPPKKADGKKPLPSVQKTEWKQEGAEPRGVEEVTIKTGKPVAFAVAASTNRDPAVAARTAVSDAVEKLGVPPKGLIFFENFPKTLTATATDEQGGQQQEREVPGVDHEREMLAALREAADKTPMIGCRARPLVDGGAEPADTVAVLAVGGDHVQCHVASVELAGDRKAVGTALAAPLDEMDDLKLVVVLSEKGIAYDAGSGTAASDFVRGVLETAGKDVVLFGGGAMPDDGANAPGSVQFCGGKALEGHVVAMGIGGPIGVRAASAHEFTPAEKTLEVTKSEGCWVVELDGLPAATVYREIRGMEPDDEFTSNWQHPIGLLAGPEAVCPRMVVAEDRARGALRFVAPIPEGTKVKVLFGGGDAGAILDSAGRAVSESLEKADDATPLVVLAADSFARSRRLREFRPADEGQLEQVIASAMGEHGDTPIFGFCACGALGPVAGELRGLNCAYHQHTFLSIVLIKER